MSRENRSATAVVVGGGVVGLFTAWRLLDAGFSVTLLERGQTGQSASWAGGGILSPLPPWGAAESVWNLASVSAAEYPAICELLRDATGLDPQWGMCGMWVSDANDTKSGLLWAQRQGLEVVHSRISAADSKHSGLLLPWVAQVRNPRLLKALVSYLRQRGLRIAEHSPVSHFMAQNGVVRAAVCTKQEQYSADVFVAAAGAWTPALLLKLGWDMPIEPVRGQMILLKPKQRHPGHIVLESDRYLIPRRDGRILVGSTIEHVGFDESITPTAQASLFAFAQRWLADLTTECVEAQWCGLRPGTRDGVPYIQQVPEFTNLWVNSGHYRNGITLAPASARHLVNLITNSPAGHEQPLS